MDQFETLQKSLQARFPDLELRVQEPMRHHTTFRVGGPVSLMALPKSEEEVQGVLQTACQVGVTPFFLGKGSNLLVADEGVDAFVVKLSGGLTRLERESETVLCVGSGVTLAETALFAADCALTGMEFAHGIPGTLGGAVYMNAGAYDGEMADILLSADYLDAQGNRHRIEKEQMALGYRHSIFSETPWLVVSARLGLRKGDRGEIQGKIEELARRRREKQPLEYASAGSTFKRPVGHFAGGLIQQCGLKGKTIGGAQVSEKHAGFVINTGNATCGEILSLIRFIRETVQRETGVLLEPEVRMLGCSL